MLQPFGTPFQTHVRKIQTYTCHPFPEKSGQKFGILAGWTQCPIIFQFSTTFPKNSLFCDTCISYCLQVKTPPQPRTDTGTPAGLLTSCGSFAGRDITTVLPGAVPLSWGKAEQVQCRIPIWHRSRLCWTADRQHVRNRPARLK